MYNFKEKFSNKKYLFPILAIGTIIIVGAAYAFSTGTIFKGALPIFQTDSTIPPPPIESPINLPAINIPTKPTCTISPSSGPYYVNATLTATLSLPTAEYEGYSFDFNDGTIEVQTYPIEQGSTNGESNIKFSQNFSYDSINTNTPRFSGKLYKTIPPNPPIPPQTVETDFTALCPTINVEPEPAAQTPPVFDTTKFKVSCAPNPQMIASGTNAIWQAKVTNNDPTPIQMYYIWGIVTPKAKALAENILLTPGLNEIQTNEPRTYTNTTTADITESIQFTLFTLVNGQEILKTFDCKNLTVNPEPATPANSPPADLILSCPTSVVTGESFNARVQSGEDNTQWAFNWTRNGQPLITTASDATMTALPGTNLVSVDVYGPNNAWMENKTCSVEGLKQAAPIPPPALEIGACKSSPQQIPAGTPTNVIWEAKLSDTSPSVSYLWEDSTNSSSGKQSPEFQYNLQSGEVVTMKLTATRGTESVSKQCEPLMATTSVQANTVFAIKSCVAKTGSSQIQNATAPVSGNWVLTVDNPKNETATILWKNINGNNDSVSTSTTTTSSTTPFGYSTQGTYAPTIQVSAKSLTNTLNFNCTPLTVAAPSTGGGGGGSSSIATINSVTLSAQPFDPNTTTGNKSATISYSLSNSAQTTIQILKGTTVVYDFARNDAKGTNTFVWNGKNNKGAIAENGKYTLTIKTKNNYGQDTYTGTDKLEVKSSTVAKTGGTSGNEIASTSDVCTQYKDITTTDRSYPAFQYAKSIKAITGNADCTVRPEEFLQRDQIAKIITEGFYGFNIKTDYAKGTNPFPDITNKDWSFQHIAMAKQYGIITGYKEGPYAGLYRPGQYMTRAEFLTVLLRAIQNMGKDDMPSGTIRSYADTEIGQWYSPYVKYARDNSLFDGNYLFPDNLVTRREVADIIYKLHLQKTI